MNITANDVYALGLAVGNILRDVDPAKRDQVLELIRALEQKAGDRGPRRCGAGDEEDGAVMSEKITLEIEFEVGSLEEIGLGGFKANWLDATNGDTELNLTAGAGMGNPLLEAYAREGKRAVYAKADIRPLARRLFGELEARLPTATEPTSFTRDGTVPAPGEEER